MKEIMSMLSNDNKPKRKRVIKTAKLLEQEKATADFLESIKNCIHQIDYGYDIKKNTIAIEYIYCEKCGKVIRLREVRKNK